MKHLIDPTDLSVQEISEIIALAEDIIATVAPIRERIEDIRNNDKYLHEVAQMGAEKARRSAQQTVDAVREIMGIYKF